MNLKLNRNVVPTFLVLVCVLTVSFHVVCECGVALPLKVHSFDQAVHTAYDHQTGLVPEIENIVCGKGTEVFALSASNVYRLADERWDALNGDEGQMVRRQYFDGPAHQRKAYLGVIPSSGQIRDVARRGGEVAVAAENGLFLSLGASWRLAMPQQGDLRWAPVDVRAVVYDLEGHLWFASPQGVGRRLMDGTWELYTGADGLPFNDFTCVAAGKSGVWFGTTNGAIRFAQGRWEFRQGRRWLVDNHVLDIDVAEDGKVWFATMNGVSSIDFRAVTLRDKARFYEQEIDRYHRRTRFGYVGKAKLAQPGDKSTAVAVASDNEGFFNGLYLGAMSLAYAVTGEERYKAFANQSFESLAFLSEVTQGGANPGPPGLIARTIQPTKGENPNLRENAERDRRIRSENDALWKVIDPRWPIDETGEWYWKCDASADELDGHYFGYGIYFDRVCKSELERDRVRLVVRRITDHLIDHDFRMIDHDGKPTRWSRLSPTELNSNDENWEERGLNSWSVLTYLLVAHHVTGDLKYRELYLELAHEEGFALNGMTQPQVIAGPGSYHQADDDMSFMNYYHLLRYEHDPRLLGMYRLGAFHHWRIEQYERNPFFNFVYAACCLGKTRRDHWGTMELLSGQSWLTDSVQTLKLWPLDLIDWPMSNAHRIDLVPLPPHAREPGGNKGKGFRVDGYAFSVDEQLATYLEDDVWQLEFSADGTQLRDGTSFLLAYYMGIAHGFIADP